MASREIWAASLRELMRRFIERWGVETAKRMVLTALDDVLEQKAGGPVWPSMTT